MAASREARNLSRARRLDEMTWLELRDLASQGDLVGVLPIGALEAHGPHLPLDTDRRIAVAVAEAGASRLEAEGIPAVVLPPVDWTPAPFAGGFPGTVDLRTDVLRGLLAGIRDACRSWGIRRLVFVNAHFDPAHVGVLRDVALEEGLPRIVFPDLTRRRLASELSEEFRRGCHGGAWETSLLLAIAPDSVRPNRNELRPTPISMVEALQAGHRTFEEAGAPEAWVGDPASATAALGIDQLERLARIVARAVLEVSEQRGSNPRGVQE